MENKLREEIEKILHKNLGVEDPDLNYDIDIEGFEKAAEELETLINEHYVSMEVAKELKFETKKAEQRTLEGISHTGAIFTCFDENGVQHWFRVEEVKTNTDKEGE